MSSSLTWAVPAALALALAPATGPRCVADSCAVGVAVGAGLGGSSHSGSLCGAIWGSMLLGITAGSISMPLRFGSTPARRWVSTTKIGHLPGTAPPRRCASRANAAERCGALGSEADGSMEAACMSPGGEQGGRGEQGQMRDGVGRCLCEKSSKHGMCTVSWTAGL